LGLSGLQANEDEGRVRQSGLFHAALIERHRQALPLSAHMETKALKVKQKRSDTA
jgi:hypothetical protein